MNFELDKEAEEVKLYSDFIKQTYLKMKESFDLLHDQDILTPDRINRCLADYSMIHNQLFNDYKQELIRLDWYKKEFDHWTGEQFLLARDKLKKDAPKSKTISSKEIESQAYSDNKEEWKQHEDKLFFIEAKCSYLKDIRDSWLGHSYMLKEISNNMKVEMRTLNTERIMENPKNKVIIPQRQLKSSHNITQ